MRRTLLIAIIAVLVLALVAIGIYYAQTDESERDDLLSDLGISLPSDDIEGSGFIEATVVGVASEIGGELRAVHVAEGDTVTKGMVLARLENDALEAERTQAQAALDAAQAGLAGLQAGGRPEQIRQAELAVSQAEAGADGARRVWDDARRAVDDPRTIDLALTRARAELSAAEASRNAAQVQFDAAEAVRALAGVPATTDGGAAATAANAELLQSWWAAWAALQTAQRTVAGAEASVASLEAAREEPRELMAAADAAQATYEAAFAGVDLAKAQLALAQAGPSEYDLALADAAVRQAEARLRTIDTKRALLDLTAPMDGQVVDVTAEVGEMLVPGAMVLRVGELDPLHLTIYVAEGDVGELTIGGPVEVTVDALEDDTFEGTIVSVASEAEFTPKNVQTKDERANLVYAVQVRLPNPDGLFKIGMPADAVIAVEEEE